MRPHLASMDIHYKKIFGVFRNPKIREEIAALDPQADCQRIVHLLVCYEFPFDITRSLELALFHTYGSVSISALLDKTGEFRKHGQKRYDDTRLLISHFLEDGYDSDYGRRAISRMNAIHGNSRISNDDFLFVLSTFISYPIDWLKKYGYRPFTSHEEKAWFHFFRNVGGRMQIRAIPTSWPEYRLWVQEYENKYLVYADSNRRVADATIGIFEAWFPWPLKALVQPAIRVLISERLRTAFGFNKPSAVLSIAVRISLNVRKHFMRAFNIERHPKLISNTLNKTYPGNSYTIEGIAPTYFQSQPSLEQKEIL